MLGRNGAGKTTTLRSLMGLTPPREGTVRLFDADVTGFPPYRIAAAGAGYVPEGRRVFANLTVEENLKVPVERPGPWTIARIYEAFPRLAERKSNKGSQLSGGEQEMLSISRALLLNPKLLMLDEPSRAWRRSSSRACSGSSPPRARRAFRCCWSSRTSAPRWRSPTAPMCSTTAGSSTKATPQNLDATRSACANSPAPAPRNGIWTGRRDSDYLRRGAAQASLDLGALARRQARLEPADHLDQLRNLGLPQQVELLVQEFDLELGLCVDLIVVLAPPGDRSRPGGSGSS